MRRLGWIFGLAGIGLLAGCAGTPNQYYSLAGQGALPTAAQQSSPAGSSPASTPYGVRVRVSEVPPETDRLQLLIHDPARAPAVDVLNQSLWAAPVADQIQAILAAQVSSQLGVPDLQRIDVPRTVPVRDIEVRITRFDLTWGQGTALGAVWVDHGPGEAGDRLCQARIQTHGALPTVASLVDRQRQAVQQLAVSIATAATASGSPQSGLAIEQGCT